MWGNRIRTTHSALMTCSFVYTVYRPTLSIIFCSVVQSIVFGYTPNSSEWSCSHPPVWPQTPCGAWRCSWGWRRPASCWCPRWLAREPSTTAAGGGEFTAVVKYIIVINIYGLLSPVPVIKGYTIKLNLIKLNLNCCALSHAIVKKTNLLKCSFKSNIKTFDSMKGYSVNKRARQGPRFSVCWLKQQIK